MEKPTHNTESKEDINQINTQYHSLAEQLTFREAFSFQGLKQASYEKLKAESDEFPEFAIPIDELIARFEAEGIKVVVATNGNIFILPAGSTDIENDSILPRDLEVHQGMDEGLKKLIELGERKKELGI